jgi:hypothetical protein
MTPELQRYYEQRLSMMGEEAWKDLMFDVEQMLAATNDLSSVQDEKMLHFRRGEISMMRWMLSLKETSENAYKGLQDETTD